jgi:hypothetical protein
MASFALTSKFFYAVVAAGAVWNLFVLYAGAMTIREVAIAQQCPLFVRK